MMGERLFVIRYNGSIEHAVSIYCTHHRIHAMSRRRSKVGMPVKVRKLDMKGKVFILGLVTMILVAKEESILPFNGVAELLPARVPDGAANPLHRIGEQVLHGYIPCHGAG